MTDKTVVVRQGSNLFGLVGLLLVILKLAEVEPVSQWSWWLVTLPWWIGFAFLMAIVLGFLLFLAGGVLVTLTGAGCLWLYGLYEDRKSRKAALRRRRP